MAQQALNVWERRLATRPHDPAALSGLAAALLAANRPQDAAALLAPRCDQHPTLLRLLARALRHSGQRGPAIGALFMAEAQTPNDPALPGELADALLNDGNPHAALPYARTAWSTDPSPDNATTLSCILLDLGQQHEALAITDAALARNRRAPAIWTNRSIALEGLDRMDEAIAAARAALKLAPASAFARHQLATALLADGQLTPEAWRLYEARLALDGVRPLPQSRRWHPGMPAGTVLLHAEQGLGDTLQFVRYAPLVAALSNRVILAVQPALVRLLRGTPGIHAVIPAGSLLPPFDTVAPLLSLPGLFGTTLETIPPPQPYANPAQRPTPGEILRVGLAWAGSTGFVADAKRSLPEHLLPSLTGLPGIALFALQLGAAPRPAIPDLMQGVHDMASTAAIIAGLDLVITVDTAVAHLAATMGKPTWLLSRHRGCWRWLRTRADSPWYPTLRIFRQHQPNDWTTVLDQVRTELQRLT